MKPRRLHSATISSRLVPASVSGASLMRRTLLGADREFRPLALGVAKRDLEAELRAPVQPLAGLQRAASDLGHELVDGLARLELQRPAGVLGLHLLGAADRRPAVEALARCEGELARELHGRRAQLLRAGLGHDAHRRLVAAAGK